MGDSRRVVDYTELWEGSTSTNSAPKNNANGKKSIQNGNAASKSNGWSADGTPQTASSARKLRKVLTLIQTGNVQAAESEIAKMGSAKNNFEIQRALVMTKTGKMTNGLERDEEEEEEGEEEDMDGYDDNDDNDKGLYGNEVDHNKDESMEHATFDWQGAMSARNSNDGRQLTHAEIWDDSALVDAWNAAEEEYKLFHAQRSAHELAANHKNGGKRTAGEDREEDRLPKKRSALWYDSPAKGSQIAANAKAAQQEQEDINAELAERKKQARALLARVAGDEQSSESTHLKEQASVQSKRKKLKGTTPPSSSISGNLAWHSACATVSKTPNAIGATVGEIVEPILEPSAPQTFTSIASEGEEIFQNLAMAWYYAGYYQSMAANWSNSRGS